MTKESKELLIADLSARLPYGVKCYVDFYKPLELVGVTLEDDGEWYAMFGFTEFRIDLWEPKPYLKPMSSLSNGQMKDINWCYKNHYDCNGLIDKGLALPAEDGMYN